MLLLLWVTTTMSVVLAPFLCSPPLVFPTACFPYFLYSCTSRVHTTVWLPYCMYTSVPVSVNYSLMKAAVVCRNICSSSFSVLASASKDQVWETKLKLWTFCYETFYQTLQKQSAARWTWIWYDFHLLDHPQYDNSQGETKDGQAETSFGCIVQRIKCCLQRNTCIYRSYFSIKPDK